MKSACFHGIGATDKHMARYCVKGLLPVKVGIRFLYLQSWPNIAGWSWQASDLGAW